jgi:hypothetical protein
MQLFFTFTDVIINVESYVYSLSLDEMVTIQYFEKNWMTITNRKLKY